MATVTATSIIDRVSKTLQDDTNVRWARTELLGYLNDGQREIVLKKPNAYVINAGMTCAAGTKQKLPTSISISTTPTTTGTGGNAATTQATVDPIQLIDVVRNVASPTMGAAGGAAVRLIAREILDSQTPDWHTAPSAAIVKHYSYSEQDLKTFYIYPPNNGTGNVEVIFSASPPDIAAEANKIALDDVYQAALIDYCLYRAYNKDSEYSSDPARASAHYVAFDNSLGNKMKLEVGASPNHREEVGSGPQRRR